MFFNSLLQTALKWITPHSSVKCSGTFQPAFGLAISALENFSSIRGEVMHKIHKMHLLQETTKCEILMYGVGCIIYSILLHAHYSL